MAGDPTISPSVDDVDMRDGSQSPPPPPAPPVRPLFSISLVCQSNVNRSMEAHRVLADQHWPIALYSYGVGSKVRLPGRSAREANVFEFGTPYTTIIARLTRDSERAAAAIPPHTDNSTQRQHTELTRYHTNGIIPMLQRDSLVKPAPERWVGGSGLLHFNVVLTFETRVYDTVLTSLMLQCSGWQQRLCHVVNIETPDNTSEAAESGQLVQQWVSELVACGERWEEEFEDSLVRLQAKHGTRLKKPIMHFVWWY